VCATSKTILHRIFPGPCDAKDQKGATTTSHN
jgi:hypothetical protein